MTQKRTKWGLEQAKGVSGWPSSIETVNKELMDLLGPMIDFPANTTSVELKFGVKQCPSVTITYLISPEKEGGA